MTTVQEYQQVSTNGLSQYEDYPFNHHLVTRGYLWLPVKKLHLSALNNCYFKLN